MYLWIKTLQSAVFKLCLNYCFFRNFCIFKFGPHQILISFQMFWYQWLWVCLFCPWIIYIQVTLKITDCLCWLHVFYYQFSFDLWALFLSLWLALLVFVFDRVGWSTSSSRGAPPMTRGWQKPATSTASSWFTQRHACSTTEGCSTSNRYEDK